MTPPFSVQELLQRLELRFLEARDQLAERGPASTLRVELRLVVERDPAAPQLVEELHPPELVEGVGVECHAVRVAAEAPTGIGVHTDALAGKPRCGASSSR